MATPLIFPTLSRQPSMDTSKTAEDDTIRDPVESGYVATRPRYTRSRRTWKINVRNLQAEDVRALDAFFNGTAARGGNSFLYPNLLLNGSFELPALSAVDLVAGWNVSLSGAPQEAVSVTTAAAVDGTQAVSFASVAGQSVPNGGTVMAALECDAMIPCAPGEVYLSSGSLKIAQGTLPPGVLEAYILITFYDGNGDQLSQIGGPYPPTTVSGWQNYAYSFTVPAGAARFEMAFVMAMANTTGSTLALDGSASVLVDGGGCALLTPLTPYGRMAGSQPLGCLVRFTKLPEISDIGMGGGVKLYGANFELTEV